MKASIILLSYILSLAHCVPSGHGGDCEVAGIPKWHPPQPNDCK
jgi:hypothetical protein